MFTVVVVYINLILGFGWCCPQQRGSVFAWQPFLWSTLSTLFWPTKSKEQGPCLIFHWKLGNFWIEGHSIEFQLFKVAGDWNGEVNSGKRSSDVCFLTAIGAGNLLAGFTSFDRSNLNVSTQGSWNFNIYFEYLEPLEFTSVLFFKRWNENILVENCDETSHPGTCGRWEKKYDFYFYFFVSYLLPLKMYMVH